MITREFYPWFLGAYHLVILIGTLALWYITHRLLRFASRHGNIAYGVGLFAALEAIGVVAMLNVIRSKVEIRDEALNFLTTHGILVVVISVVSFVCALNSKEHKGLLILLSLISIPCLFMAVVFN